MTDGIFLGNIVTWIKIPRKTYISTKLLLYITANIHTGITRVYIRKKSLAPNGGQRKG